ncbi:conserved hypothetical protein [Halobacteriovorax marinus SJ]|uniref:Cupin type-2 domain-containing protein n=1 Tax=Halobacteriovorax marinus (strain ATCC BAA-682 / DSM 15412 / SJ) TaxID=862908 RepID=E1X5G7_HALMS|nr:cupin domain-containing protein [Halobacteriovorax marinus]CBW27288.1 conserved hypothetical protein [Halobacteriovorax marinus SJ]
MEIKRSSELNHKLPTSNSEKDYPFALSAEVFKTNQLFLYSEKVRPGTKASAPHYHRSIDEIIYVTNGELIAVEGSKETKLESGDFVIFKANSELLHYLENRTGTEATFLIFRRNTKNDDVKFELD